MENSLLSVIIIKENLEDRVDEVLDAFKLRALMKNSCKGISKPNLFSFLNFNTEDKTIFFFLSTEKEAEKIRKLFALKKLFEKHNSGIMFSLKEDKMKKNALVVTVVNYGYSSSVMQVARKEGASGGTIFSARGTGAEYAEFLGVSLDSEKEVVLNVVEANLAGKIVRALKNDFKNTNASGITFSLPVSNFLGINITKPSKKVGKKTLEKDKKMV